MKKVLIGVDLSFGDSGKGTTTDFLVRKYGAKTVVRYCGGPQAAHNVIDQNGTHHTFAQFGSGTLVPDTKTFLSRYMLIDPLNMENEERFLKNAGVTDVFDRMFIDEDCVVITPFQKAVNRLRELHRGEGRHGSCGRGIGETVSDSINYPDLTIRAKDLVNPLVLKSKLEEIQKVKIREIQSIIDEIPNSEIKEREWDIMTDDTLVEYLVDRYLAFSAKVRFVNRVFLSEILEEEVVVFEGSQGVLLDEWYGFHPYTTWSTTTAEYANKLLAEAGYDGEVVKIGILRALTTRHGPGPFPTYDEKLSRRFPDTFNVTDTWQREFRVGYFDTVMHSYALNVVDGVDCLMITHADLIDQTDTTQVCRAYRVNESDLEEARSLGCITQGDLICALPCFYKDLKLQERLTELLLRVTPVYSPVSSENYITELGLSLETPVTMLSFGPRSDQKRILKPVVSV
jgi:adenylosuccinate synthase